MIRAVSLVLTFVQNIHSEPETPDHQSRDSVRDVDKGNSGGLERRSSAATDLVMPPQTSFLYKIYEGKKKASDFAQKEKRELVRKKEELEKEKGETARPLATFSRDVRAIEDEVKSFRQEREELRAKELQLIQRQGILDQVLPRTKPETVPRPA